MYFNGNPTAGLTINLVGTVASGDVFVLAQSSASAAILAQADQASGGGWYNGDDAVALVRNGVAIDVIGQIGTDPGVEWGIGLTSTADNTLRRASTICAGDTNGSNAFDPAAQWEGFATDTFGGLGSHTAACGTTTDDAPTVTSTYPVNGASDFPVNANLTVTFSEPVLAMKVSLIQAERLWERLMLCLSDPTRSAWPITYISIGMLFLNSLIIRGSAL